MATTAIRLFGVMLSNQIALAFKGFYITPVFEGYKVSTSPEGAVEVLSFNQMLNKIS